MSTAKTASEKGVAETSNARYYHLLFEFLELKCKMRSLIRSVKFEDEVFHQHLFRDLSSL